MQSLLLIAGLATALVLGAILVSHEQSSSGGKLTDEFNGRAQLAGQFTSTALQQSFAQQTALAGKELSGPPPSQRRFVHLLRRKLVSDFGLLIDSKGKVLASYAGSGPTGRVRARADIKAALAGHAAIGPVIKTAAGQEVEIATPFGPSAGRRVLATAFKLGTLDSFANRYLGPTAHAAGGDAFIIEGTGLVLGTSTSQSLGRPIADPDLAGALRQGPSGSYDGGSRRYVAIPVDGTGLRIVLTASQSNLLSPLAGTRWTAWALYGLLAVLLIGGGALFLRRRARDVEAERTHDPLTGLPNKGLFTHRVESALKDGGDSGAAVIFIDIDRFKRINQSFGHRIGDQVLRQFAERIRGLLLPGDTVARFGGDRFTVLRPRAGQSEALDLVNRIQQAAETPFEMGSSPVSLAVTVGIAVGETDGDADALLRRADTALGEARQRRVPVEIFGESMEGQAQRRIELEATLRDAIREGELVLHYQPIVSLRSGQVTAFEALVRWEHPVRGLLPPAEFIPLAEETGVIVELGDWVLRKACEQAAAWRRSGHDLKVAVNLSGRELSDVTLTGRVREALGDTGLDPDALILEITESALASSGGAILMLTELRKLGVETAIDDFGVGYSSWSRLARLPIDMLKIDRSFVSGMDDERTAAVLGSMVRLGGSLGLAVVAEGVETAEEAQRLAEMGCQMQGFYFSKPVPAEEAEDHLDDRFSTEEPAPTG